MPSPNSAAASGRPAATTEPKVSSSTPAAIARPTASEEISPCCAFCTTLPPSATRGPPPALACSARSSSAAPVSIGTAPGDPVVSGNRTTPTVPSGDSSACAARTPVPMPSSRPAEASSASIRAVTGAAAAPAAERHTTSTVSAERWGKRSASSSAAALDSDPGVL